MIECCYKCQDRKIWQDDAGEYHRCHDTCSKYTAEKEKMKSIRKAETQMYEVNSTQIEGQKRMFGRAKWKK